MAETLETVQVTCPSCGSDHSLKILPDKGQEQRWACPNCKAVHTTTGH